MNWGSPFSHCSVRSEGLCPMKHNRRECLKMAISAAGFRAPAGAAAVAGKRLGTIFNNDINNILAASSGSEITPAEYQRAVFAILDMKPGVLTQNVGMPDPVIYSTSVATTWDKYHEEVTRLIWPTEWKPEDARRQAGAMRKLLGLGANPLTLTIEACRQRGVPIVASYRMNAEDFYRGTTLMSDFGRAHPDWKIPGSNCLDPAIPQVYAHRMDI